MAGTVIAEEKYHERGPASRYYDGPDQLKKVADPVIQYLSDDQKRDLKKQLTQEMMDAAAEMAFERAAELRDTIEQIDRELKG